MQAAGVLVFTESDIKFSQLMEHLRAVSNSRTSTSFSIAYRETETQRRSPTPLRVELLSTAARQRGFCTRSPTRCATAVQPTVPGTLRKCLKAITPCASSPLTTPVTRCRTTATSRSTFITKQSVRSVANLHFDFRLHTARTRRGHWSRRCHHEHHRACRRLTAWPHSRKAGWCRCGS